MSAKNRFSDEFKKDVVSQVVDRGYPVAEGAEGAERLGVSTRSIYNWKAQFSKPAKVREREDEQAAEPPRVYRRVKHSKDEPYDEEKIRTRLSCRAA